jgi:hypothetical protein
MWNLKHLSSSQAPVSIHGKIDYQCIRALLVHRSSRPWIETSASAHRHSNSGPPFFLIWSLPRSWYTILLIIKRTNATTSKQMWCLTTPCVFNFYISLLLWSRHGRLCSQALEFRTPLFPHLVPPAIMVWIFVWKYIFEPFIHILQHFVLHLQSLVLLTFVSRRSSCRITYTCCKIWINGSKINFLNYTHNLKNQ